jgi:hypothetical protein
LQEGRRTSTIQATAASAANANIRKTKKKRKASKSDEEKTPPTPKKAPVLQSIEEGEEDVPKARDDNQQPGVAFTPRLTQTSKGKKRKNEQSDAPEVAGGKLKSPRSLLNDRTDFDTENEDEDHQPRKKKPKKASRKEPESESESEFEEAPKQQPKKGKQNKKPKARTAERKK